MKKLNKIQMNWNLEIQYLDNKRPKIITYFKEDLSNIKSFFMISFMEGILKGIEEVYINLKEKNKKIRIKTIVKNLYNNKKKVLKEFNSLYKKYGGKIRLSICRKFGYKYGKKLINYLI